MPAVRRYLGLVAQVVTTFVVVALVSAAAWFGWFGWDTSTDAVTGPLRGSYEAWQIAGSALTVLAAVVVAVRRAHVALVAAAAAVAYAVAWSSTAMKTDDSGAAAAGSLVVLFGVFGGAFASGWVAQRVWNAIDRRPPRVIE